MGERLNRVRRKAEPLLRRFFHAYFLIVRGMMSETSIGPFPVDQWRFEKRLARSA